MKCLFQGQRVAKALTSSQASSFSSGKCDHCTEPSQRLTSWQLTANMEPKSRENVLLLFIGGIDTWLQMNVNIVRRDSHYETQVWGNIFELPIPFVSKSKDIFEGFLVLRQRPSFQLWKSKNGFAQSTCPSVIKKTKRPIGFVDEERPTSRLLIHLCPMCKGAKQVC